MPAFDFAADAALAAANRAKATAAGLPVGTPIPKWVDPVDRIAGPDATDRQREVIAAALPEDPFDGLTA